MLPITDILDVENNWLTALEEKLVESPKASVDAEELSEELDVSIQIYKICTLQKLLAG